ncbi:unnamed protein product [Discula destructiva]
MARDYWVEGSSPGRTRYVKVPAATTPLSRSQVHDDGSLRGSTRSARVDFTDVTRKEANALRRANEDLERENATLKATFRATDYELRKYQQATVPALETTVRNLELENARLRETVDEGRDGRHHHHHHHHHRREREDSLRKLRNQNTRLRNDNDALQERVSRLERDGGAGSSTRRLVEEVRKWKAHCASLDDEAERMYHRIDAVVRRNKRLETANESAARQTRELQRNVDYYKAILRRYGITTR